MAARSRPRGQLKEEFDEERVIWNSIKTDGRRVDQLMKESDVLQEKISAIVAEQSARIDRGEETSARLDDELEDLLRDNIRNLNEAQTLLQPVEGGNDVHTQMTLLAALRMSEEAPPSASRATSVGHGKSGRDRQGKRKLTESIDDRDSIAADSPGGPSPKVVISSQKDRLVAKSGSSRAGSVPVAREGSVKIDEDDSGKEVRPRLSPQTEVLYRNNAKNRSSSSSMSFEGEGILCRVTSVIGEGKQRRYEIIDADPDPPTPSVPYRASVNHLIPIPPPSSNTTLPDLSKGKNVLALYPGTTTFYKAEVVAVWRQIDGKVKKEDGSKEGETVDNLVRLRFEGEDEADREMSVERRYQQHNQNRPPPSPSHSQAGSIAGSQVNGGGQNGIPMVNGLPSGGQQTDMNHLWAVVQQLSQLLEENKAQTRGIVEGVAAIQGRAAQEEGGEVGGGINLRGGGGVAMREVNGEINAATVANLQSQLTAAQSTIASLTSTNSSLSTLLTDYESALTLLLDKLRPYAYSQTSAMLALHKYYQSLLDQERSTSMGLRLEHADWQAGLSRVAENARNALRCQSEIEQGLRSRCKELGEENRVLRRMVGWEERESSDDEAEDKA
ncbi:hypothetical protein GT037_007471 [Alternaria burnsii]|uniref:SGF29 C-terminal domain-containing protein n=1 Tax=Alternaria burnsii TaxID=1187904 RepID=A0A8H7EE10_9PLEO|nr:uncharacterized protein GT037_007471 [Alternaria burnsii]KAF7674711.1 hypothetical protein GT037_007471 [Alternaria burnsii]